MIPGASSVFKFRLLLDLSSANRAFSLTFCKIWFLRHRSIVYRTNDLVFLIVLGYLLVFCWSTLSFWAVYVDDLSWIHTFLSQTWAIVWYLYFSVANLVLSLWTVRSFPIFVICMKSRMHGSAEVCRWYCVSTIWFSAWSCKKFFTLLTSRFVICFD